MDFENVDIIFFDAGMTLLYLRRRTGEVYAEAARTYGINVAAEEIEESFARAFIEREARGGVKNRAWWRDVVVETFAPWKPSADLEPLFNEMHEYFRNPDAYVVLPGAMETVDVLRARGYRTALISNWDERLPVILDGLGLTPLLDPIVISERVGVEKPDPLIFQVALAEALADAEHSVMVGDDYAADVRGAAGVGMRSILIGDDEEPPEDGAWTAVKEIADIRDLLPGR